MPPISLLLWTIFLNHLLPDCLQISYIDYFYQTLAQVLIWALSDNQDGHQNGPHLSVYTCGHSNLNIYHPISSKFHIWTTFIKLLFMSEYGFCPMNDYQKFCQKGYPLFRRRAIGRPLCRSLTVLVYFLKVHVSYFS